MTVDVIQAKLISMLAIGVGSFVVGVAPVCFVTQAQDLQRKLVLSCTLCFGGGVLLATSVLHMLPEVRESMPKYAELVFSCGFLLLYLIDEFVHYFCGSDVDHAPESCYHASAERNAQDRGGRCRGHSHQVGSSASTQNIRSACMPDGNLKTPYRSKTYGAVQYGQNAPAPCCNEEATFLCHGNHAEPCSGTNTNSLGLLLALTVHAVLEGLAIGLQKKVGEVFLLVGAVASHKFVVGFCLGLELASAGSTTLKLVIAIFVFAIGSALGIGAGMLIQLSQADQSWSQVVLSILQGLAGGTLLYVTVSEVFPRERARWHRSARRSAGILQFVSATVGFILIFLLNNYVET